MTSLGPFESAGRRHWLITGVSSGLGQALAQAALARGDVVMGTVRKPEQLDSFERLAPGRALAILMDVTDADAVPTGVAAAFNALGGRLDVLVNNAGYGLMGAVEELSDAQIRDQFETNLFGVLNVTRAALPSLRAQGSGHLVFVSSVAALIGRPAGFGIYNASKHALEGMAETLAGEIRPFGLKVTMVEPGPFRTGFAGGSLRQAPATDAYRETVGETRRFVAEDFQRIGGDPAAAAAAILAAVDANEPPLRLLVGRHALDDARRQLRAMLAEIDAWEAVTLADDDIASASGRVAPPRAVEPAMPKSELQTPQEA